MDEDPVLLFVDNIQGKQWKTDDRRRRNRRRGGRTGMKDYDEGG